MAVYVVITSYSIHYTKLYELGDKDGLAYTLTIGAMIPLSMHDYESTKRMLEAAVEACKETRNEFVLGRALGYFGLTCLLEDNTEQAVDYFSQLVTLAHDNRITSYNVCYTKLLRS